MLRHGNDVKGQAASGSNREGESTEAGRRGGAARSSLEGPVMGLERRGCVVRPWPLANWKREEPVDEAKPFKHGLNIGSRVTREGHARFWERPEVKFLRATRRTSCSGPRAGRSGGATSPSTGASGIDQTWPLSRRSSRAWRSAVGSGRSPSRRLSRAVIPRIILTPLVFVSAQSSRRVRRAVYLLDLGHSVAAVRQPEMAILERAAPW